MIIDLHTHSNKSDGTLSPYALVELAKAQSVNTLALTDHDTVGGVEETLRAGYDLGVNIIPGIELSTTYNKETIHVLGYFKGDGYKDTNLINFLNDLEMNRMTRAKQIVINLKKYFNIDIDYNSIINNNKGVIARPHIAKAIIDAGYNYTFQNIFKKFLGDDSPAYVPNKKVSTDDGINLLKSYGCITSLAHPVLIKKNPVEDIISLPFHCIEAVYYLNFKKDEIKLISLAQKYKKAITCGSDFHGYGESDTKHGNVGSISITPELITPFLNLIKN